MKTIKLTEKEEMFLTKVLKDIELKNDIIANNYWDKEVKKEASANRRFAGSILNKIMEG